MLCQRCLAAFVTALAVVSAACSRSETPAAPAASQQRTFATPEDAVRALNDAAMKSTEEVIAIFGPEGRDLIEPDATVARQNREVFTVAMAEGWRLVDEGKGKTLVIGNESWPFPVPLVKEGNVWRFDTAAGKEEVIARRIGKNELAAIRVAHGYVTAQKAYAKQGHDGRPPGLYASRIRSEPGTHNGLYWPAGRGQKLSPVGDLLAAASEPVRAAIAASQAVPTATTGSQPAPFHGYYFRVLTGQGATAPGGAKSFLVNGQMSGGFGLVAWPAEYGVTGIMTFIVNQDGIVHEKDLGDNTRAAAEAMTLYEPDQSWTPVP